jgi:hypothetical protein
MQHRRLGLLEKSAQNPTWHLGACPKVVGTCFEKHRSSSPTHEGCLNRAHLAMEIFVAFHRSIVGFSKSVVSIEFCQLPNAQADVRLSS